MKTRSSYLLLLALLCFSLNTFAQKTKKLEAGYTARDFTGTTYKGKSVTLFNELGEGPVILLFYRGNWSEECMAFLKNLQDSIQYAGDKKTKIIAITPEGRKAAQKTANQLDAKFTIICDVEAAVMKLYDVEHKADPHFVNQLKTQGVDLVASNETNGTYLPVPAVYVIGKNKKVNYVFFEVDYSKRPSVATLLEALNTSAKPNAKKK